MTESHPVDIYINQIQLKNFRKYEDVSIDLSYPLVIITGKNGSGKTSILEAITLMSTLKSFRNVSDRDMIKFNKNFYTITLDFFSEFENKLHMGFALEEKGRKQTRVMSKNREKIEKIKDFIGLFNAVVFSPDDLQIVERSPSERRSYFDSVISMVSSDYISNLQKYKRVIQLRSKVLHAPSVDDNYLKAMDKELIYLGSAIQQKRVDFVSKFKEAFRNYISIISNGCDSWFLEYSPSIVSGECQDVYSSEIQKSRLNDKRLRQTTRGIHRDRYYIYDSGNENSELQISASQGQKRSVVLALKMSQYEFSIKEKGMKPVLLIDDVLTELDDYRKSSFIHFLNQTGQTIITTTSADHLNVYLNQVGSRCDYIVYEFNADGSGLKILDNRRSYER